MSKPEIKKSYFLNGNIWYKRYYLNGKLHRDDGPAVIRYYRNGNIRVKEYHLNGKLNREDGPDIIYYDEKSNKYRQAYYISGEYLAEQEWFKQLNKEAKLKFTFGIEDD